MMFFAETKINEKDFFDNLVSFDHFLDEKLEVNDIISRCVSLNIIYTKASLTFLANFSRLAWQQQDHHALFLWLWGIL